MKIIYIIIAAIILWNLPIFKTDIKAAGNTIYADINLSSNCTSQNYSIANRNCTGTNGNAYKRVNDAVAASTDGDTLLVRAGTYREKTCCAGSSENGYYIYHSLTMKPYNQESVILTYDPANVPHDTDGTYGALVNIEVRSSLPMVFEGFELEGYKPLGCTPIPSNPGICRGADLDLEWNGAITNATGDVTIRNNKLYNAASSASDTTG